MSITTLSKPFSDRLEEFTSWNPIKIILNKAVTYLVLEMTRPKSGTDIKENLADRYGVQDFTLNIDELKELQIRKYSSKLGKSRATIVFFPGRSDDHHYMGEIENLLSAATLRNDAVDLITYNHRGTYDNKSAGPTSAKRYIKDAVAIANFFEGRVLVHGKSLGGGAAGQVCMESKNITKACFERTFSDLPTATYYLLSKRIAAFAWNFFPFVIVGKVVGLVAMKCVQLSDWHLLNSRSAHLSGTDVFSFDYDSDRTIYPEAQFNKQKRDIVKTPTHEEPLAVDDYDRELKFFFS